MYKNLRAFRESLGMTQKEFAASLSVAQTTYNGYETGAREPKSDFWIAVAQKYGVTIDYLMGFSNDPLSTCDGVSKAPPYSSEALKLAKDYDTLDAYGKRQVRVTADLEMERCKAQLQSDEKDDEQKTRVIPLFRTPAAAGYVSPTEGQDYDDYEIPYNLPGDFAVRIDGDSMEPYIHDGEIVRCVRSNGLQIGDVGIFYVDGDTLCKQYCTDGSNLYLLSLNRKRADADRTVWHFSNSTVQLYGKVLMRKKPPMP